MKTNSKVVSLRRAGNGAGPSEPCAAKLARLIAAYAPYDDSFELRIPGLHASRFSRINSPQLFRLCGLDRGSHMYRPGRADKADGIYHTDHGKSCHQIPLRYSTDEI